MGNPIVRILSAELNNFRNVEHGVIEFACNTQNDLFSNNSDVLGIYGQNGSGKTTFISALSILRSLLSGNRLPKAILNYINVGSDSCYLSFLFSLVDNDSFYKIKYDFRLGKREEDVINLTVDTDSDFVDDPEQNSVVVLHERLSYSTLVNGKWSKLISIIDCDSTSEEIFKPKVRFDEITIRDQNVIDNLRVAKKLAIKQSTSFIFANDTLIQIRKKCQNSEYKNTLFSLSNFGKNNLYIIDNRYSGLIDAKIILPIIIKFTDQQSTGIIPIRMEGATEIPEDMFYLITGAFNTLNTVLCEIVPGLTVELTETGRRLLKNGKMGISIELSSKKDGKNVPFTYESEGIKKIVSILHMLILMYNNPSMTLAIDELDNGIFEYLLGEILKIIEKSGRGQLIFTSHNLRPLEMLDKKSIVFTTTNPRNRYIRFTNVRPNNNLRSLYYHDLLLGGRKECVYEPTNSFAINRAFRTAGERNEF